VCEQLDGKERYFDDRVMAVTVIVVYSRVLFPSLEDIDEEVDCPATVAAVVEVVGTCTNEYCSSGSQFSGLIMLGGGDFADWTSPSDVVVVENGRAILDEYKIFRFEDVFADAAELL
jgi:hypothetical protein